MEGTLGNGDIDLLPGKEVPELHYADRKAEQLRREFAAIVKSNYLVLETMEVEQIDGVRQWAAGNHDLVLAFQVADHCRKHVDVRRVCQFEPDSQVADSCSLVSGKRINSQRGLSAPTIVGVLFGRL